MITEEEISHQNNNFFDLSHPIAHIVTAPDLNLSPFAHEISSVEAPKEGKFEEAYSMDIIRLYWKRVIAQY